MRHHAGNVAGGVTDAGNITEGTIGVGIVSEFAVGVLYPTDTEPMGGHRYLMEFHREPSDAREFASVIDETLQAGNEDYATHRNYGLLAPTIDSLPEGAFLEFMRKRSKIGGQHKVPRVLDQQQQDEIRASLTLR